MIINLNELYQEIASKEAGKQQVNTAQISDVMAAFGSYLRSLSVFTAFGVFWAIRSRAGKRSTS